MTPAARATTLLVTVNLAVYAVILAAWSLRGFFPELPDELTAGLSLSNSIRATAVTPWKLITYMFTHISFVHLSINMLWLIGFGPMMKSSGSQTVLIYLLGGICGAAAFMLCPETSLLSETTLAGASAAVLAVVTATACLSPRRKLNLLLTTEVKLLWVALIAIITLVIGSAGLTPVTAAHFAGIIAGGVFGLLKRRHNNLLLRKSMENARQHTRQLTLIHKAGQSGFASLSDDERIELFHLQNNSQDTSHIH